MCEASVSGRLRITPEAFLLIPSSLGGDASRLLKDAKAEAGLHPVWSKEKKCDGWKSMSNPLILQMEMRATCSNGAKAVTGLWTVWNKDTEGYVCMYVRIPFICYWLNQQQTERIMDRKYHVNDKENLMNPVSTWQWKSDWRLSLKAKKCFCPYQDPVSTVCRHVAYMFRFHHASITYLPG